MATTVEERSPDEAYNSIDASGIIAKPPRYDTEAALIMLAAQRAVAMVERDPIKKAIERGDIFNYERRDYKNSYAMSVPHIRNRFLLGVGFVGILATPILAGALAAPFIQKQQRPHFRTITTEGCVLSEDFREVREPEGKGIDFLALKVGGVTSEYGPGSECLTAAKVLIVLWSKNDGVLGNEIVLDSNNPAVAKNYEYRVPLEAIPAG